MPSGGGIHRTTSVPFTALAERRARHGQPAGCVVQATAFISSSHLSTSDCAAGNNSGQVCVAGDQFAICVHSPSVLFASGKGRDPPPASRAGGPSDLFGGRMLIRLAARGSICALASLSSGLAVAQTATTQFGVQITIVSECQINAADDMD